ncbi:MAG: hypothetical protein OEY09_11380 [Gammaproteobacteria bacterium]|nr:hypothetical protein [Gammaproteobacteria bacterium]
MVDELITVLHGKNFYDIQLETGYFVKRKRQDNWAATERRVNQFGFDF